MKIHPDPKMKFFREGDSYFAIVQNEMYKGKMCEELLYAEIEKTQGGWQVVWEDNFKEKHKFQLLENAQQYVMLEYHKRTPHVNGKTWEIDEE